MKRPDVPASRPTRREFLRTGALAAGALLAAGGSRAETAPAKPARGVLVDLTRCIGCRACESACQVRQGRPPLPARVKGFGPGEHRLSPTSLTFIDEAADGSAKETMKRQCLHCVDPACVSVCPVGALRRTENGSVVYLENRCIGCRYCFLACPYGIPRYEWHSGLSPRVVKCDFCDDRAAAGKPPACVAACPTGALKTGDRDTLLTEAHGRLAANPRRYHTLYGEHEAGGTGWLYLSHLPVKALELPDNLPDEPLPALTGRALAKVPFVIAIVGLAMAAVERLRANEPHPHGEEHE